MKLVFPPGAETKAMVEGDRYINGLRPTRLYPEGVGFYNLLWTVRAWQDKRSGSELS